MNVNCKHTNFSDTIMRNKPFLSTRERMVVAVYHAVVVGRISIETCCNFCAANIDVFMREGAFQKLYIAFSLPLSLV